MEVIKNIKFPKISDPRGNLTFLQYPQQVPFEIKRVFWTYNVPGGETRGGHAYYSQEEVIIALSGSFDVVITDKKGNQETIHLNRGSSTFDHILKNRGFSNLDEAYKSGKLAFMSISKDLPEPWDDYFDKYYKGYSQISKPVTLMGKKVYAVTLSKII